MSSIWVTLLDTSRSMSEGFSGSAGQSPDPLAEQSAWQTKIEAAKEVLLSQIARIRVPDLAVFEFRDAPTKLFQGTRDQFLGQPQLIQSLRSGWWNKHRGSDRSSRSRSLIPELPVAHPPHHF